MAIDGLTQILNASSLPQSYPLLSFVHAHGPYGLANLLKFSYRTSTNYGLATNHEATPIYEATLACGPTTMNQSLIYDQKLFNILHRALLMLL